MKNREYLYVNFLHIGGHYEIRCGKKGKQYYYKVSW